VLLLDDSTIIVTKSNQGWLQKVAHTKFLGLVTDYTLTWDNHTDQSISRLNSACYAIRAVKAILSWKALIMLHFSYVHSITPYGIIFGVTHLIVLKYSEWK
jgi:hypothetical protein